MSVVGIDFGTTFSSVGVWSKDHVEIVSNAQGERVTPSVVAFSEDERLVGDEAASQVSTCCHYLLLLLLLLLRL